VATLMPDGDVLVAGGLGEDNLALTSAEVYDPRTNLWVTVASMAEFHSADTATLLRTGLVLVVGATGQSRAELYDLAHNRWSRTGPSMDRYQHSATRLSDGRVLIVGGYGADAFNSALVYDPKAVAPVPLRPPDQRMIAVLLLTALLVAATTGWSIPSIRQRLQRWRPPRESEEWIA
jgi:N-acetylneuraminic acid mutarotase